MAKSKNRKSPRPRVGSPVPAKPAPIASSPNPFRYGGITLEKFNEMEDERIAKAIRLAPKRKAGLAAAKKRQMEIRKLNPYGRTHAQRFLEKEDTRIAMAPRRAAGIEAAKRERTRLANLPKKPVPVGAGKAGGGATDDAVRMGKRLMGMAKKHPILAGAGVIGMGAFLGNRQKRGTSSGARGAYR